MAKEKLVSQHYLVPKHRILTKEEIEELKKKYGNIEENTPLILSTDPMAEELGAQKGDIIKIIRKSMTAGESIYYRRVV